VLIPNLLTGQVQAGAFMLMNTI
jgi:hypothetical protein